VAAGNYFHVFEGSRCTAALWHLALGFVDLVLVAYSPAEKRVADAQHQQHAFLLLLLQVHSLLPSLFVN
jgi:hypothetical protein